MVFGKFIAARTRLTRWQDRSRSQPRQCVWIGCWLVFACAFTPRASAQAPDDTISIVTYNIRYANPNDGADFWPHRVEAVADFLDDHDLFGLQEATFPQIDDLSAKFTTFDFYGVGRDDGKQKGEAAPIFFRSSRFDVTDKGTIWLSKTPKTVASKGWDAALPRTMTWMILRDKQTDKSMLVANTHFDHRGATARTESAKLIRSTVGKLADELPIIVMGDFNCTPDSDPYNALTAADGDGPKLIDARAKSATPAAGPNSTWSGFQAIIPDRIIDHIFVHGNIHVLELEIHNPKTKAGRFASDHLPVRVKVRLSGDSE